MNQPLTVQIREALVNFVAGRQTLHEFEQWFNMHALTPVAMGMAPESEDLVYEIEFRISEQSPANRFHPPAHREPMARHHCAFTFRKFPPALRPFIQVGG
jgi:hypothetical protein